MKLAEIVDPGFKSGLRKLMLANVPLKTAYRIKTIINDVNNAISTYDEVRIEAIKRYAKKDEKGELVMNQDGGAAFEPEEYKKFVEELALLGNTDVNVGGKIKISDLGDDVAITADELMKLEGLLES